jgi:hypothetical protein
MIGIDSSEYKVKVNYVTLRKGIRLAVNWNMYWVRNYNVLETERITLLC